MKLYKELRHANAALTFEKMAQNLAKKEALTKISNAWWRKAAPVIEEIKASNGKIGGKPIQGFSRAESQ